MINPGLYNVADGDSVIVGTRAFAEPVAKAPQKILDEDNKARLNLYKKMGREPDKTVLPSKQ